MKCHLGIANSMDRAGAWFLTFAVVDTTNLNDYLKPTDEP
jgi:hypothetical protein